MNDKLLPARKVTRPRKHLESLVLVQENTAQRVEQLQSIAAQRINRSSGLSFNDILEVIEPVLAITENFERAIRNVDRQAGQLLADWDRSDSF